MTIDKVKKQLRCSICGQPIRPNWFGWEHGNNAEPVNDGRCCDICNDTVVVPTRLQMLTRRNKRLAEVEKNDK